MIFAGRLGRLRWSESKPAKNETDTAALSAALCQLTRFSDRELSDIGLARSDLTQEGLAVAGTKRRSA